MTNNKFVTMNALLFAAFVQVSAQEIKVSLNNINESYLADFSKPFSIALNGTNSKSDVAVKQGIKAVLVGKSVLLSNFTIQFLPSIKGLIVLDNENRRHELTHASFAIQVGEKSFAVIPRKADANVMDSSLIIDVKAANKTYEMDFLRSSWILFKPDDVESLKDVVILTTSSEGAMQKTLKKQDLERLKLRLISNGGILDLADSSGKTFLDDEGNRFKIDDGAFAIKIGEKTFKVQNVRSARVEPSRGKTDSSCTIINIIDDAMLSTVNGIHGCQLCDLTATENRIKSKSERMYSTDYIVVYDPMLKNDAYTICKHSFRKIENGQNSDPHKWVERYNKISPRWFAPKVGSQIRFEVVNVPLNSSFKLSVDELDVFNGRSSQFASIIDNLVNANIMGAVGANKDSTSEAPDKSVVQVETESACFLTQIDHVANELLKYIVAFKISSCAVEAHTKNLAVILSRANSLLGISAATTGQLDVQLARRIYNVINDDDKAIALQKGQLIVNALKALENVQPIAYTTLRAKNRDYIEIRYRDGNNEIGKPQNIRMSGGMKIDFSAGFILTGLKDYSYILRNSTFKYTPEGSSFERDTTGVVIVKEDEGNNQVGVALLTHFYPRLSSHYNIGGTAGLMTSTNLNLRIMLGGSVLISSLFGSNNRISFSGGIVWGKVKRLGVKDSEFFNSPRFVNNIPEFYSETSAPPPIDRNESSWFFALTMNFGGQ